MTTQKEIIQMLSEQTGYKEEVVATVIEGMIDMIIEQVINEETVVIRKLGTFYQAKRKEREYYSVTSKKMVFSPATRTPRFKVAPSFKEKVSTRKEEA